MENGSDWLNEELSHRRVAHGENRLPPAAAVVVAAATYALLPESLLFAPRYVIPAVEHERHQPAAGRHAGVADRT